MTVEDIFVEFDAFDPAIVDVPDEDAFEVLIIQGADGRSMQPVGQVPAYADLPTLGPGDSGQVWLAGGLAYIWDGAAWPPEADGVAFQGPQGDRGRGITGIAVSGGDLVFAMSEAPTPEVVAVPALSSAQTAATNAAASAAAASASAGSAGSAKTAAEAARDTATGAATSASSAATAAGAARDDAEDARDIAVTKAGEAAASATGAAGSASAAAGSASGASTSATNAATSFTDAASANTAAQAAKTAAQSARTDAQTAATAAAASQASAAGSAADALDSAADAAISSGVAAGAATTATGAATTASTARDGAAASAMSADASATAAAASETNAAASETNAATSETNAAAAAADASTSATNAGSSATSAEASADDAEYWAGEAAATVGSGIPNATTSTKGGVQLSAAAGEVGGTFDHLVVNGWASKADLVGGKIPAAQLPQVAIMDVRSVANTAARLALTDVQTGDIAVQSGNPGRGTYILSGSDPSQSGDWTLMVTDMSVMSVNGFTGIVVLGKADVGLGSVDNTSDANKPVSTAQQTALNGKAPTARAIAAGTGLQGGGDLTADRTLSLSAASQTSLGKADSAVQGSRAVSTGAGLTGGGDLSANRTIAVDFGSTAGKVCAGDDARLSDMRVPANDSVTSAKIVDGAILNADINANAGIVATKLAAAVQTSLGKADTSVQQVATPMIVYGTDGAGAQAISYLTYGQTGGDDAYTIGFRDGAGRLQSADGATGLDVVNFAQLAAAKLVAINAQTAAYTLAVTDASKAVEVTSASAVNLTVPPNSGVAFPVGTVIEITQLGAGQITIVAGAGVTLQQAAGLKTRAQYSSAIIRKRATDTWLVTGDTAS